ncbi:hypothetical protein M9H77_09258 [Catharanthus roseus]|uniref:Uncharacterized protein n=1 Tax=Catharanthus roseus TaxID=4058 RepID=A0ACC0C018_CATRO|nr:hypothetical protein M9H77_09258 [Catharanthus roseus]
MVYGLESNKAWRYCGRIAKVDFQFSNTLSIAFFGAIYAFLRLRNSSGKRFITLISQKFMIGNYRTKRIERKPKVIIGGGGGGAFVGGGAEAPAAEEKKEEKEESDGDMGFSLFD